MIRLRRWKTISCSAKSSHFQARAAKLMTPSTNTGLFYCLYYESWIPVGAPTKLWSGSPWQCFCVREAQTLETAQEWRINLEETAWFSHSIFSQHSDFDASIKILRFAYLEPHTRSWIPASDSVLGALRSNIQAIIKHREPQSHWTTQRKTHWMRLWMTHCDAQGKALTSARDGALNSIRPRAIAERSREHSEQMNETLNSSPLTRLC